jgi:hypothetical protein
MNDQLAFQEAKGIAEKPQFVSHSNPMFQHVDSKRENYIVC